MRLALSVIATARAVAGRSATAALGVAKATALAAAMAAALAGCKAMPQQTATTGMRPGASDALQRWVDAFNVCDVNAIAALYDEDAVFWGTSATMLAESPAGIRKYFERVCAANLKPQVAIGEEAMRVYGDIAIDSGSYTFAIERDGQLRIVPARFSFVFRHVGNAWLIVDHHSSLLPVPPAPIGNLPPPMR